MTGACTGIPREIWWNLYDHLYMLEKLFTFLLHIEKLIVQIVCSHPVATGRLFMIFKFIFFFYIYDQGKQTKMLQNSQLQPDGCKLFVLLFSLCVK